LKNNTTENRGGTRRQLKILQTSDFIVIFQLLKLLPER
jgi:hypothetical protein